jgi:hypothetical protein
VFPRKHYFVKQPFVGEAPVLQCDCFRNTDIVGEETREGLGRDAGSIVCLLQNGERSASAQTSGSGRGNSRRTPQGREQPEPCMYTEVLKLKN